MHGSGETFERDGAPCNECHTHQGFTELQATGGTIANVDNPAPVNCRTCHQIHTTFEGQDFALVTTDPVTLRTGETFDIATIDQSGNASLGANLCANCHQARPYDDDDLSGATAVLGSRAGYHHGTQANVLSGQTALDLPGEAMPTSTFGSHTQFACVGCHMQDAYGKQAGGHTWSMLGVYHGAEAVLNAGGCDACHTEDWIDVVGNGYTTQSGVATLLDEVATELRRLGLMQAAPSTSEIAGTYPTDQVKAFLNFKLIEEDYSLGVHNPNFARGVLTGTRDYLQTLPDPVVP